ncbi:MAG: DUF192 domain-containing protein [Planctomycetes bacterium]|nr:DUF192 domain-containing protein [Planctomycetota bacterium]
MTRRHPTLFFLVMAALVVGGCSAQLGGCNTNSGTAAGDQQKGNDLDSMSTTKFSIGETEFQVWIANTAEQREKGLMFVEMEQMQALEDGTERGMLFIFEQERTLSFWMKDTFIPLDIAYARSDGTIVKIHTMTPLDLSGYSSVQPARYALEVNAGVFAAKGIAEGDIIKVPD